MVLVGLLVAVVGVAVGGYGLVHLRNWHRIRASDPVSIRDAAIESGPVEVEGRLRALEEPLTSPLLNKPCVAYEYEVEERRRRRRSNGNGSRRTWKTVDSGSARRPFLLEDDSGTAYVDPDGATLSMETERTRSIDDESQLPPGLRSSGGPLSIDIGGFSLGSRPMRYTEKRLDVDGPGYAFGQAEPNPAGVDAVVAIRDGPETPMFLVSDAGEAGTMRRFLYRGLGGVAGAVLAFAVAFVLVV